MNADVKIIIVLSLSNKNFTENPKIEAFIEESKDEIL